MKLTERLKEIEQFVLDQKPPPEIRKQIHFLQEHLEMEDSLLERISAKDASLAQLVNDHGSELAALKEEQSETIAKCDAAHAKAMTDVQSENARLKAALDNRAQQEKEKAAYNSLFENLHAPEEIP